MLRVALGSESKKMSVLSTIKTPLGAVLVLVVTLVLASISIASSISGQLTAAAISASGIVTIILIIGMIGLISKSGGD